MPRARRRFSDGSPLEGPTIRAARAIESPPVVPDAHRVSIRPVSRLAEAIDLRCSCGWVSDEFDTLSPAEAWKLEWGHVTATLERT